MHSAHSRFCVAVLRRAPAQKCTRRKDGFQSAPNQIVDQRGINDRTEDILSVRYDVVNGQVVYKTEVKAAADRKALDCYSDVDVEALKDSVLWHEVCGQLTWLILSRHLPQESVRSYLEEEKQRLKQGFAKVDTKM